MALSVRGVVRPGELTAILGGSFKEDEDIRNLFLLGLAAGVMVYGDVRINGVPADSSYMKRHSGFMHQEDMFIETMTVLEHIWFMARMKLDGRIHSSDIRLRINRLLRDVGLIDRSDTRIGDGDNGKILSGGEKKRLAFATELLTDPEILFLDEPTTGLDAHSASVLVSHMVSFALRNRTVLCTIHQPSSTIFDSFHRIIFLAGGRVAFAGTSTQAIQFFSSVEPRCWLRLYWLIYRGFLQVLRDPSVQLIRILQKVSIATTAGLCFVGAIHLDQLGIQAVDGVIYLLVCENAFFPMYTTLALIPQELSLLLREYKAGMYSVHLYYLARMISLIPGLLMESILFTIIMYWLAGLRPTMDALSLTILVVIFTINVSTACACEITELPCLTEGAEVLDRYDFNERDFWPNIILMAVIYAVFHLLAYVFLWRRCKSK
ncbi:Protein scarlet [Acromyrmex echinatior]|uniref:Protein scarlet n=1 Tax=Acromyrmex echinatior TaxID=103372 RepID=F4WVN7_ACREC|nr:Protein scarlet [Acromyrmex echinatior]